MKFTYSSGQRPLDGYTIKRGIGQGGFGEVYLGLSDAGKEVALKLVRGNLDVEVRGISQCLNLKHPNLVHLYDLRSDGQGNQWVIMEYVAGEPLSTMIGKHPQGLPAELVCEWFAGLASAIHYLHSQGIVHRDLKPANIFIENGVVKVGDYGLCKFLGGTQRAGQTQSVGTVYYMAPEISTGNYNRQIDIYAAGIILYEMLTGKVPFEGETAGEILMKHLTSPPDLTKVPSGFVPILAQALSKDPANRFPNIVEMNKKVSGQAPVKMQEAGGRSQETGTRSQEAGIRNQESRGQGSRLAGLPGSLLGSAFLAGILAFLWAVVFSSEVVPNATRFFFLTVACSWAVLIPSKWWTSQIEDSWARRLVLLSLGLGVGVLGLWLDGYALPLPGEENTQAVLRPLTDPSRNSWPKHPFYGALYPDNRSLPILLGQLAFFGLLFLTFRWWKMSELHRPQRFQMASVLAVGLVAFLLLILLPGSPEREAGFVSAVLTATVIQLASPWEKPQPARSKKLRLRYV